VVTPELSLHFDDSVSHIEKWIPEKPITAVHFDSVKERYFLKRFCVEIEDKEDSYIKEGGAHIFTSFEGRPVLSVEFEKLRGKVQSDNLIVNAEEFISVKGFKAIGNQLSDKKIKKITLNKALPYELPKEQELNDIEVDEEAISPEQSESQISLDF
jgi:topoisomerase-4 subunit A